jgi:ribosomal protein S12 methylthiotransferase
MKKITASIISLGCARNLVDSELILGKLKSIGLDIVDEPDSSDMLIINTCAFIEDAKKEAIDTILKAITLKKEGRIKKIIVCGCLGQRYGKQIKDDMPEVDAILGVDDFKSIGKAVLSIRDGKNFMEINPPSGMHSHKDPRIIMTPPHYAYVKISEGCRNRCSYCAIYKIRGDIRSRTIKSIVSEVNALTQKRPIPELNIIAQDTTSYGLDRYKKRALPKLLRRICRLNRAHWIRLLYTHPRYFTEELISIIAQEESICKYVDLPVQHISDKILSRMNRHISRKQIEELIKKIRQKIPGVALRTSVIVGFPGETEEDFTQLLSFIKYVEFERLGAFIYSREEGTPAYSFKNQVGEKVKRERFNRIMKLQQDISKRVNQRFMNSVLEVMVEERVDKCNYTGRTQYDAPEVDGIVHIKSDTLLKPGDFVKVKINDTLEYDLVGKAFESKEIRSYEFTQ